MLNLPETASLDADCRKALDNMLKGEPFDVQALLKQTEPAAIATHMAHLPVQAKWVRENADCLTCGACCRQGWRVDVKPADLERMSEDTRATFVTTDANTKQPVMQLVQIGPPRANGFQPEKKCACQKDNACTIYEERPEVCRTFEMGHLRCVILRLSHGLPVE